MSFQSEQWKEKGFGRQIEHSSPGYKIPTRQTMTSKINMMAADKREKLTGDDGMFAELTVP